ncbi:very short patch repair endonuclease [Notoacmeibacter marinus]|uniref:very short patch repair endonuclease n=1 Tax=Notoacmeibacter marinus TaxID=1876515 RepID=UPI000DF1E4A3|nr:very short patch repair endonuclease [Notoacmeibacter marinus]
MTETAAQRSRTMRAVRDKNTKPEKIVRSLLHQMGYRFRLHRFDLPGKPDIVFPARNKLIFVHGCFWHGHECKRGARPPKTNVEYWTQKISRNKERDQRHLFELDRLGWDARVVWECELKDMEALRDKLNCFLGS